MSKLNHDTVISDQVLDDINNLIVSNMEYWLTYSSSNTLTIGVSDDGQTWSYQTGDNSFTGGVYGFASWGVCDFDSNNTPDELLCEVVSNLIDNNEILWK